MTITDEIVTRAAKAFSDECDRMAAEDGQEPPTWDKMSESSREHFCRAMRAALLTLPE